MTSSGPTILSLIAATLYGLVMLFCLAAAAKAVTTRQAPFYQRNWAIMAAFFAVLILVRLLDLEHALANDLRDWLRSENAYGERRMVQGPIALAIAAMAAVAALAWFFRTLRQAHGRRAIALALAQAGGLAMVVLIALRLVSLSAIDAALYGPLKLNWFVDLGASLAVGGGALLFLLAVRQRGRRSRNGTRR